MKHFFGTFSPHTTVAQVTNRENNLETVGAIADITKDTGVA